MQTQPIRHKGSYILQYLSVPVLITLCGLDLKILEENSSVCFHERCWGFRALRTMGKYTSRHLYSYEY